MAENLKQSNTTMEVNAKKLLRRAKEKWARYDSHFEFKGQVAENLKQSKHSVLVKKYKLLKYMSKE